MGFRAKQREIPEFFRSWRSLRSFSSFTPKIWGCNPIRLSPLIEICLFTMSIEHDSRVLTVFFLVDNYPKYPDKGGEV